MSNIVYFYFLLLSERVNRILHNGLSFNCSENLQMELHWLHYRASNLSELVWLSGVLHVTRGQLAQGWYVSGKRIHCKEDGASEFEDVMILNAVYYEKFLWILSSQGFLESLLHAGEEDCTGTPEIEWGIKSLQNTAEKYMIVWVLIVKLTKITVTGFCSSIREHNLIPTIIMVEPRILCHQKP